MQLKKNKNILVFVLSILVLVSCGGEKIAESTQFQFVESKESRLKTQLADKYGNCSLEMIIARSDNSSRLIGTNTYKLEKNKVFKLGGFAVNKEDKKVPKSIILYLIGNKSYELNALINNERVDVQDFFKEPSFKLSGYVSEAGFKNVDPGEYEFFLRDTDTIKICPTFQKITVE